MSGYLMGLNLFYFPQEFLTFYKVFSISMNFSDEFNVIIWF